MGIQKAKQGDLLEENSSGFPMFFDKRKPRVITADAWGFLEYLVVKKFSTNIKAKTEVLAFIEQAYDFYEAATNPQLGSKPLLYYYSFINLAKVSLRLKGVRIPPVLKHGIHDPGANIRKRFHLEGQKLHVKGKARDLSELFPEFVVSLGCKHSGPQNYKLLDILKQIPSIHRTFTQVTSSEAQFLPIKRIEIRKTGEKIWGGIILEKKDKDVVRILKNLKKCDFFTKVLTQVMSEDKNEIWFETQSVRGRGRGVDNAIRKVAKRIRSAQLSTILTHVGYRYYFNCINKKSYLPILAVYLAAMFYLGSITRYKPADFDKIQASEHGWLCDELLATLPTQFLYILCSELAAVDVVIPYTVTTI